MKKILTAYFLLLFGVVKGLYAQESYAAFSDNYKTLTFYYDSHKEDRNGMDIGVFTYTYTTNGEKTDSPWNAYRSKITTVVFDSSFANCSNYSSTAFWFLGFDHLTNVNGIENFETENVVDMNSMFSGCSALTTLDLSSLNTEKVKIMRCMFDGCSSLTHLNVSNFKTENVTDMYSMFLNCKSLESLNLSSFNTSNVKAMTFMFSGCSSLVSLDLSGFDTSNVSYDSALGQGGMEGMFLNCSSLTSLNLCNFNTSKVTSMDNMFNGCKSLKSIDVSSFKTDNVYKMGGMFEHCHSLETLDLSAFNTSNVEDMSNMFYMCHVIQEIYVGEDWNTSNVTKGDEMFTSCFKLVGGSGTAYDNNHIDYTYAHIDGGINNPGYLTSKSIGEPYALLSNNNSTLKFYYDGNKLSRGGMNIRDVKIYTNGQTSMEWDNYRQVITTVEFDNSFAKYNTIPSTVYWFYGFSKLTSIKGIENLKTAEVTDMHGMFENCSSLTTLNLNGLSTSNVTDMSSMFRGCSSITNLNLSGFNTENVKSMYCMFEGCSSLNSLDISGFNTSNVENMTGMFDSCKKLTSLNLGNFDTSKVQYLSAMFWNCSSLTHLDLSNFNTDNVKNIDGMFGYLKLEDLDLSSFNTEKVTEMGHLFHGCSKLKTIYVSDKWNTSNVVNGEGLFTYCNKIIGEKGTTYSENHTDYTYARIDGGPSAPGYFTSISSSPDEGTDIIPIEFPLAIKFSQSVSGATSLVDNVVDNVYYNLYGNNGYDALHQCLVINNTTDMENIANGEPGSDDIKNNFVGLILQLQGSGVVELDCQTIGTNELSIQIGPASPITIKENERNTVIVDYHLMAPTCLYIYSTKFAGAASRRATATENCVKLWGITVKPSDNTDINESITELPSEIIHYYTLDGRKLSKVPTKKGIYIMNGKKVFIK